MTSAESTGYSVVNPKSAAAWAIGHDVRVVNTPTGNPANPVARARHARACPADRWVDVGCPASPQGFDSSTDTISALAGLGATDRFLGDDDGTARPWCLPRHDCFWIAGSCSCRAGHLWRSAGSRRWQWPRCHCRSLDRRQLTPRPLVSPLSPCRDGRWRPAAAGVDNTRGSSTSRTFANAVPTSSTGANPALCRGPYGQ